MKRITLISIFLILLIAAGQDRARAVVPPSVVTEDGVIVDNERCPAVFESIRKHKEIIYKLQEYLASLEKELENFEKEVKQMDCAGK